LQISRVMRCARSSKLPAHPTQKRISAVSPLATSSAIVGIRNSVIRYSSLVTSQSSNQHIITSPFPPISPICLCIFPWGAVVFHVAEHRVEACRGLRFLHYRIAPQFDDDFQRVDVHGTGLYTSVAGGAGPDFLTADVIVEQGFAIILETFVSLDR